MSVRLPGLRGVQAFEAVGRSGSVAVAARDLGLSPGAVSQHIGRLEEEVGVALFERKGRSLALTSWGQIYLQSVREGFDHLRAANDVLQRARLKSEIVMSAPPSVTIRWIRGLMAEWQRTTPGVSVRLLGDDHEPVFDEEQVDFRISYGTARLKYAHFTDLFVDRVAPMCSPEFLTRHPVVGAADVFKWPLIGIEWKNPYQSPPSWSDWAIRFGIEPLNEPCEISFSLSSAAVDAAIHGAGFVLGQASLVADEIANGQLVVPCDCWMSLSEPYALAWNPATLDRPHGNEFKNFVIQSARKFRRETRRAMD
ncbi:LysR substrate-binding domain-containing protein [Rhizobium sp. BK176]|uniref:LysR substrate-binding domain-containing protein n=1 Tax=Rhizobium sp. BK176 TaxID=2587071 RepID=UPI00216A6F04|nr:LysR substrate-binding domain-containing protein [Rhizobium sp. BK176]MCS4093718.1 LysR family glycine cleavage system transcriptional activator [Rhizobium sp. BK176]